MSIARHHAEWLSLLEISGPFLSMPVLLRAFPQGLDRADTDINRTLRLVYEEWLDNSGGLQSDPSIHRAWVEWVLRNVLEMQDSVVRDGQRDDLALFAVRVEEHQEMLLPDFVIVEPGMNGTAQKGRLVVQVVPSGQSLDKPLRDARWKASPEVRMMTLLHATGVRLGLVTNGEQWMLVDAPKGESTGFISWYAQLWLDEPLTLRAFRSLLGVRRFFGVQEQHTIERLLADSANDQQELTDQLGYQVRRAVEVLVQAIDLADQDRGRVLLANITDMQLYEAALNVMMRLVFLLSAEERELLLLGDPIYDQHYAVSTLREQLRQVADQYGEEVLERRNDAWSRLLATFRAVFGGIQHDRLTLPAYGGSLFDPDRFPFLEGRVQGTSWKETPAAPLPINNRTVLHLLSALQVLQVKVPGGGPAEARRISFRALDIEQIGHVYEGLLDHTAKRANEPVLGLQGSKDREPEIALATLEARQAKGEAKLSEFLEEATGRSANAIRNALKTTPDLMTAPKLRAACGNDDALYRRVEPFAGLLRDDSYGHPLVIPTGSVYVTTGTERRATGTHYTPRSLTEPIVQHTLEPLVYHGPAEGLPKEQWRLRSSAELLDLKICDMAMGSGAFLVQTCRYMSERLVEAWELEATSGSNRNDEQPDYLKPFLLPTVDHKPQTSEPAELLAIARRLVADRCLYGVDKNPMAVEMAKLSLWLITLDKGRPFTFLDHALKCGDSLLGVDLDQLKTWSLTRGEAVQLSWFTRQLEEALDTALILRRQITATTVLDVRDTEQKARLLEEADDTMNIVKLGANLLVSSALASEKVRADIRADFLHRFSIAADSFREHRDARHTTHGAQPGLQARADLQREANNLLGQHRPFHWPLEFPEVFVETNMPGFSAIVGNPPFQGGNRITTVLGEAYRNYLIRYLNERARGNADLCAYFFLRSAKLLRLGGNIGLLATKTIAQGDTREVGLDQLVSDNTIITRAVSSRKWPGSIGLDVSHVWLRRGSWLGPFVLDEHNVSGITPLLSEPSTVSGYPERLIQNSGKSFNGSLVLGLGFVLEPQEAQNLMKKDARNRQVLFPYLGGDDLNSRPDQSPSRWVIQFDERTEEEARTYPDIWTLVEERVKPERITKDGRKYPRMVYEWWKHWNNRKELYVKSMRMKRVIAVSQATKYVQPSFVPNNYIFDQALVIITFDYRTENAF
ncbi:MAG: restriction endonuclease [Chloroflexota bacterium]|nr:restriction endonuclease [Chloroflexota bacterium]